MNTVHFNGYDYNEAVKIIHHYRSTLVSANPYRVILPSGAEANGLVNNFLPIPFNVQQQAYEAYLSVYLSLPLQDVWLREKSRENLRWIPLVMIGDQYAPLVPLLKSLGIWNEEWR